MCFCKVFGTSSHPSSLPPSLPPSFSSRMPRPSSSTNKSSFTLRVSRMGAWWAASLSCGSLVRRITITKLPSCGKEWREGGKEGERKRFDLIVSFLHFMFSLHFFFFFSSSYLSSHSFTRYSVQALLKGVRRAHLVAPGKTSSLACVLSPFSTG